MTIKCDAPCYYSFMDECTLKKTLMEYLPTEKRVRCAQFIHDNNKEASNMAKKLMRNRH